jgi:hypothetical protein
MKSPSWCTAVAQLHRSSSTASAGTQHVLPQLLRRCMLPHTLLALHCVCA